MKKIIYITLCIIGILSFSCEKEKIETDPKKAILGKWEIVEDGNWPDLEPYQASRILLRACNQRRADVSQAAGGAIITLHSRAILSHGIAGGR